MKAKRILSAIIAGVMALGMMNFTALAENTNVAEVNGVMYETYDAAITDAKDGDEVNILVAGTYTVPTGKNITVTGAVDGVVFDDIGARNMGGASVIFNNVTFDYYPNVNYTGLQQSGNLVYNNCTIDGQVFLYGASETFNNCTFNQNSADAYNIWTYGAQNVVFDGCTLNSAGKSVLVYNEGACATDLTVTDTDFIATQKVTGKAAIEIDTSLMPSGTEIVVDEVSTATGFATGSVSGNTLWNDKKANDAKPNGGTNSVVIVAGETVKDSVENVPTGSVTPGYTAQTSIWGEGGGNAKESLVVKLYCGENVIATASLNNIDGIIDGDVYVTWSIPFDGSTDKYWNVEWKEGYININAQPTEVEMVIDGVSVAKNNIQLNGPDNLNKIVAATADSSGTIQGYYTSLQEALNAGGNIVMLRDVTLTDSITITDGTIAFDLNGYTLNGNIKVESAATVEIKNGKITNENSSVSAVETVGATTFKNVDITSARHAVRIEGGTATITGGTYKVTGTAGMTTHVINAGGASASDSTVVINDGTFIGPKGTAADSGAAVNVQVNSTVTINGGAFTGGKANTVSAKGALTIKGGSFDQAPTAYVAEGYKIALKADGTYSVGKDFGNTEAKWTTDTDAGYYVKDGNKLGVMRFLFLAEGLTGSKVGISYIKENGDIAKTVLNEMEISGEGSIAFYGDIKGFTKEDAKQNSYSARGFVGDSYSDVLSCAPDFEKLLDYDE